MSEVRELLAASGKSAAAATAAEPAAPGNKAAEASALAGAPAGSSSAAPASPVGSASSSDDSSDNTAIVPLAAGNAADTSGSSSPRNGNGKSAAAGSDSALLGRLLAECEAVAAEAATSTPAALRPVSASDFLDAQKDVAPSVAPDSGTMAELRAWNAQYGEGGQREAWNPKLSYFM